MFALLLIIPLLAIQLGQESETAAQPGTEIHAAVMEMTPQAVPPAPVAAAAASAPASQARTVPTSNAAIGLDHLAAGRPLAAKYFLELAAREGVDTPELRAALADARSRLGGGDQTAAQTAARGGEPPLPAAAAQEKVSSAPVRGAGGCDLMGGVGKGMEDQAFRVGPYLERGGLRLDCVGSDSAPVEKATLVTYSPKMKAKAEQAALQLPGPVELREDGNGIHDVVIRLGTEFPRSPQMAMGIDQ